MFKILDSFVYPLKLIKRALQRLLDKKLSKDFESKKYKKIHRFYKVRNHLRKFFLESFFFRLIFSKRLKNTLPIYIYKVDSIKELCKDKNFNYQIVEKAQEVEVVEPSYITFENKSVHFKQEKIHKCHSKDIYIAEMLDVGIVGENTAVLTDRKLLNDMAKNDLKMRLDLAFGSIKHINNERAIIEYQESKEQISEGISLIGFAPWNYFHLTVELLSRLEYIDKKAEYADIPLLVDDSILKIPQYLDLLNIMNKKNRKVIPIKKSLLYKVGRLIYPSYSSHMPINVKTSTCINDFLISKRALSFIRETVFDYFGIDTNKKIGSKKLFISRKNLDHTRLSNEKKVVEYFSEKKFEIIFPERMSFEEQVKMFSEAIIIAGSTGAAFTNIIYCPKDTLLLNIIPKNYHFYLFSTMAKLLKLESCFFDADVVKKSLAPSCETYKVNMKLIEYFFDSNIK